jgi:hypothetical protein
MCAPGGNEAEAANEEDDNTFAMPPPPFDAGSMGTILSAIDSGCCCACWCGGTGCDDPCCGFFAESAPGPSTNSFKLMEFNIELKNPPPEADVPAAVDVDLLLAALTTPPIPNKKTKQHLSTEDIIHPSNTFHGRTV